MMQARHALLVAIAVAGTGVLAAAAHCAGGDPECDVVGPATCGADDCVDLLGDAENCGVCGWSCNDGTCAHGLCQCGGTSCTFGSTCCGGTCADVDTDRTNCGTCGLTCPGTLVCTDGICTAAVCEPGCTTGLTCCDLGCVDLDTDTDNCGECFHTCAAGEICQSGTCLVSACAPPCVAPEQCCGETCVNVDEDPDNCGFCGNRCLDDTPPLADSCVKPASGTAHCSCHGSTRACVPPSICCPDSCHNLTGDVNNCGTCGNVCDPALTNKCEAGNCVCGTTGGPCSAGQSCCDGVCIDTSDDMEHCGSCSTVCNLELADACVDGACMCGTTAQCTRPVSFCESPVGILYQKCCAAACVTLGTDTDCGDCGVACDTAAGEFCSTPSPWPPCNFTCGGV